MSKVNVPKPPKSANKTKKCSPCNILVIGTIFLSIFVYYKVVKPLYQLPPVPKLENTWWSYRDPAIEDTDIKPFKINVSNEILNDLQQRLQNAIPFQEPLDGVKQNYGMNTNLLKTIVDFWRTKYDWREREKVLNQYPQFVVSVQGLKIHYLHVKPTNVKGLKVLPLLLVHGWPGSVAEFYKIIHLLTTPQHGMDFVFEVIAPSLPGYGFSEAAVRPGLSSSHVAVILKNLMLRLGHEKFYIQGGDWGGAIVSALSVLFPENVIGMHSNFCLSEGLLSTLKLYIASFYPTLFMSEEIADIVYPLSRRFQFQLLETGYMHLQATKPDTVGVALRESPVGLAAYILEKFTTWTNPAWKDLDDGGLTKKFAVTELLDNVMIYWVTRSITTSMRIYAEQFTKENRELQVDSIPVRVPSGCARFKHELTYHIMPDFILRDRYLDLVHISDYDGGHFAAFELPNILAGDIYVFAQKVEALNKRIKDS